MPSDSSHEAPALVLGGLMPHPPICVPEVGREHARSCHATTAACEDLARRLVAARPDRLFLVSPHSPRAHGAFGLWGGERLAGSLEAFGAPGVRVDLPADPRLRALLEAEAAAGGVSTWIIPPEPLDHGAVVPLSFLARAGWEGPTTIASLPAVAGLDELVAFGRVLARAAGRLSGRSAVVASGDMSHRVLRGAPAGYHPRALEFDEAVCARVESGRFDALIELDPELRALAAEDVVDSATVVLSALPRTMERTAVLSYEHPFGVGYLVAVFHDGSAA